MTGPLPGIRDQPVFSLAGRDYACGDVVAWAQARGDWAIVERRACEGLACADRATRDGDPLSAGDLEQARSDFRYERKLLSAEEMQSWLGRWGLTAPDWLAWTRRTLLRELWADELDATVGAHAPAPDAVLTATDVEAVCSGDLERFARELAERAAVYDSVRGQPPAPDLGAELEEVFEHYRLQAAAPVAVQRMLDDHVLDWTRIECVWVKTEDGAVAREAAMCVRVDGRELGEVASSAGLEARRASFHLDGSAPAPLADLLVSAQPGELVGPLAIDGAQVLCEVVERSAPHPGDGATRKRAALAVARRAVDEVTSRAVSWHWRVASS